MNPQGLIRNDPSHSDNIDNGVHKLHSRKGRLLALHTKAELDATLQLTSAYTVKIPLKSASSVLKCVEKPILKTRLEGEPTDVNIETLKVLSRTRMRSIYSIFDA